MTLNPPQQSFLGCDVVLDPEQVRTPYAFLGIPYGPPYDPADLTVCADAPSAVRTLSRVMEYDRTWLHHDFDLGGQLFPEGRPTVSDCGDVATDVRDPDAIWNVALAVIRQLVRAGIVPLVVGGLDSIPPIVVGAFDGNETVNVLHVDAHLDFRHEVGGITRGFSSPIRRIRELACVDHIVQVGLRSVGSGRPSDVADALASGNRIVTAWELHERGAAAVLGELARDKRWVVTIDCDGLDPTIAPGVGWPEPGGLTYVEIATLVRGLAVAGLIAGFVVTEYQPARDIHNTTALTITRLLMNVIGLQRHATAPDSNPSSTTSEDSNVA